ncbi:MAG: peptide deformylase [Patescibacteria group bacterium]|jgi:peptide deformylase
MLKIITIPNPILRQKAKKITDFSDSKIQKLIPQMTEIMLQEGVGLAAPQVGESIRLVVVKYKDGSIAMINPKILRKSILKEWGEEGCLSVPGKYGEVKRSKKLTVRYIDEKGKTKTLIANGMLARIIQHETDHLDGILFIDKARNVTDIN